jgi:hypothetical protein
MRTKIILLLICGSSLLGACGEEPRPRSVQEFVDNPQFLEAAVVRCSVNREESRYDTECVNARQAVALIEAREERARRDRLEAESASKRAALRRTQRAAEYLAQFGETLPAQTASDAPDLEANTPGVVMPRAQETEQPRSAPLDDAPAVVFDEPVRTQVAPTPVDGGNAPAAEPAGETDLSSIRDELRRRQGETSD